MSQTTPTRHTFVNENGEEACAGTTRLNTCWEVVSTTVVMEFDGALHFEHVIRRHLPAQEVTPDV